MSADSKGPLSGCEVLIVEDDATLRKRLIAHMDSNGAEASGAGSLAEARRLLREMRFDFAAVDLNLPDGECLELLREHAFSENTGIVVMTAFGGVKKAVEAMRLGAGDYLAKPFEPEELVLAFLRCRGARAAARRDEKLADEQASETDGLFFGDGLAGVRARLETILATDRRLEHNLPPLLIEGETGTGKTVLARWLHRHGPRANHPFIAINCAALPETLVESELFGHERGAFTDARQARIGLFEAADAGTLFLDEISSLTAATQSKILTAVEGGTIRRLGGAKEIEIDARLIVASNRPLTECVRNGAFREDLYQRLDLLRIALPPLRECKTDIVPLARHLLAKIGTRHRRAGLVLSTAAEARLIAQPWPGNVRELAHELERAVVFGVGGEIDVAHLGGAGAEQSASAWRNSAWVLPETGFSLDSAVNELIAEALQATGNNVSAAARRLGVTRDYLRYRMEGGKSAPPANG
jgi:DNA-binding NtrC family response regulator